MASLVQIRTKVRSDISQSTAATSDFSDTELNGFINEGMRYIGALVKKPTDHVEIQVEDNAEGYTLPSDALLLLDAYFGDSSVQGDVKPMEILTEEAIKAQNPFWLDRTTYSKGRPERIFLLDAQTVVIDPRPDATYGATGKKLVLNYCYQPASLSADGDTPSIPIVFHDLIAKYAGGLCYSSAKMNKLDAALLAFKTVEAQAVKLSELVNKEQLNSGFYWGTAISEDDDSQLRMI